MTCRIAFGALIYASFGLSSAVQAQGQSDPTVAYAPWDVNVVGALELSDGGASLDVVNEILTKTFVDLDLTGELHGLLKSCVEVASDQPFKMTPQLCEALMRSARITATSKLELPHNVAMRVRVHASRVYLPKMPIRFALSEKLLGALVIRELPDGSCVVSSSTVDEQATAEICGAWKAQGKPGRERISGSGAYSMSVAVNSTAPARYQYALVSGNLKKLGPVTSSLGEPPSNQRLTDKDGQFRVSITSSDYPARAMLAGYGGTVSVWVGFSKTGKPEVCRPLNSTNGFYLANTTCLILLRRARFEFAAEATSFTGVRYLPYTINWAIPD